MKIAAGIALGIAVVAGLLVARLMQQTPQLGTGATVEGVATVAVASAAAGWSDGVEYHGLAIQIQSGYKPIETYVPLIREVAALGADTVLLSTAGWMEHAESQGLYVEARKTPSRAEYVALVRAARQLGLQVIVMPIVLLSHPRGNEWRGVIKPPDWGNWFDQYRDFLAHFADIAREGQAEAMIIGSELVSTEKDTAQWVRTIESVRQRYPIGKLGYSANWDHYKPIEFWDKLDFVGMTSYYKLADRANPTVDEVVAKWRPIVAEIEEWQRGVGKPIVLTEVGWCSQSGAALEPWNYYHNMKATPEGHEEQRRLYEGFVRAWGGVPALAGVIWWEWTASEGGSSDYGYTPRNKPAEQVLRVWLGENRRAGGAAMPARSGQ